MTEEQIQREKEYYDAKDRERFRTDGISERVLKRKANRKPRKKIKKL